METVIKAVPKGIYFDDPALQIYFPNDILAQRTGYYVNSFKIGARTYEFPFDDIFKFWKYMPENNIVVQSETYDYHIQYLNGLQQKSEPKKKLVEYKIPLLEHQDWGGIIV